MIFMQNRTIACSRCGRLDMFTTETVADMEDIAADQGWEVTRFEDDCEAFGLCPDCGCAGLRMTSETTHALAKAIEDAATEYEVLDEADGEVEG